MISKGEEPHDLRQLLPGDGRQLHRTAGEGREGAKQQKISENSGGPQRTVEDPEDGGGPRRTVEDGGRRRRTIQANRGQQRTMEDDRGGQRPTEDERGR